ncbi:MBL fold metallo-hydrolase [Bacillus massilinigeriensis]|uniref:MBL fold metallo-hydrolase n=1 Tax=Bacillus massilionigeriensis TaxID=1805475 RepID=UPI00096AF54F|nr:MBL fold metallo-hydrolase [Bacillus massilionigeriensis]
MKKPAHLAENLYLIDDFDLGQENRTGTYVLTEKELTIIETSASPSVPYILRGLESLGLKPEEIKYIIVTHIHLDHAGGAGLFLEHCPNATVIVHPKGYRHLIDPSRLIEGAKAVYGNDFDRLFQPILPIPENRLEIKDDQDVLIIGDDCTLTFFDTPGHANHHFSIHHSRLNGMFTGDTVGVSYPELEQDGIELYLPSTSPNQFNPVKMLQSIQLFKSKNLQYIFFGHFGLSSNPNEVYKQVETWLQVFLDVGQKAIQEGKSLEEKMSLTTERILALIKEQLYDKGVAEDHQAFEIIALDIKVCTMGLIDYLLKQMQKL